MIKLVTSKLIAGVTCASLAASLLLAPLQATAGGTVSKGHGVKCAWVVVSIDPVTGARVYQFVCSTRGA